MIAYYMVFGMISVMALACNLFPRGDPLDMQATLTLPGIAAIALTLGMAIDANVLINERVREELRAGMTPQMAIQAGYERAFGDDPRLQRDDAHRGRGAPRVRLGPHPRLRGRALPGHPHLDLQRGRGLARAS